MSQLTAPSPVSPPYSQHSPLVHHHLGHPTVSHQQIQQRGLVGKRSAGNDCNDNLTIDTYGHNHQTGKKIRRGDLMDVSLKSSVDGNSSCRSTPLTPLSSKSGGSQDGSSSPNGMSPSLFHQQASFRAPGMMTGMMMAGSSGNINDPTGYSSVHQTTPTAYYQQPYYHHLYPNPHHQHHGYYQTHHQSWTADFGLHHHHAAAASMPAVPSLPPSAATTAYQHSFPLTPDGSCGTGTAGDSTAVPSIYDPSLSNVKNGKDSMTDDQVQSQDSYTPNGSSTMENNGGLIHQHQSELNGEPAGVVTTRESLITDYPYKTDCGDPNTPSYYTK